MSGRSSSNSHINIVSIIISRAIVQNKENCELGEFYNVSNLMAAALFIDSSSELL